MILRTPLRLAALAMSIAALPGCVAALIPVAAGSVMAGKDRIGGRGKTAEVAPEVSVATAKISVADAEAPDAAQVRLATEEETRSFNAAPGTAAPVSPAEQARLFGPAEEPGKRDYAGFYAHASEMAARDPVYAPRRSALLAAPASLDPATTECGILPPAVLIDLDPADQTFDPALTSPRNPALAAMLAALRRQSVEVLWVSALSAGEAGAVRRQLVASGLDPFGRDPLILMRGMDERKQTRRTGLAQTHCIVAIAGDDRTDFDELFGYLKSPTAAAPLEVLFGAGWFIAPPPLALPITSAPSNQTPSNQTPSNQTGKD